MSSPRLRFVGAIVGVLLAGVLLANAQPIALGAVHVYQRHLSPLAAGIGLQCRFTPTCSRYAEIVIARDGVVNGGWATITRIARCGPWTARGTRDEP